MNKSSWKAINTTGPMCRAQYKLAGPECKSVPLEKEARRLIDQTSVLWGEMRKEGSPGIGEYLQTNREHRGGTETKGFRLTPRTPVSFSYKGSKTIQQNTALF